MVRYIDAYKGARKDATLDNIINNKIIITRPTILLVFRIIITLMMTTMVMIVLRLQYLILQILHVRIRRPLNMVN